MAEVFPRRTWLHISNTTHHGVYIMDGKTRVCLKGGMAVCLRDVECPSRKLKIKWTPGRECKFIGSNAFFGGADG